MKSATSIKAFFLLIFLVFGSCDSQNSHIINISNPAALDRSPPKEISETGDYIHVVLFSDDLGNELNLGLLEQSTTYKVFFEMHNLGDSKIFLKEVAVNAKNVEFDYNDQCLKSLLVSQKCRFEINIKTKELGDSHNFINFEFSTKSGNTQSVGIEIFAHVVQKQQEKLPVEIKYLKNLVLNFGDVPIGSRSRALIEIENKSEITRTLNDIQLKESSMNSIRYSGGDFPGSNGTCTHILKQGSCLIEIEFAPKSIYKYLTLLEIVISNKEFNLTLSGTGIKKQTDKCFDSWQVLAFPDEYYGTTEFELPYHLTHSSGRELIDFVYGVHGNTEDLETGILYNEKAQSYIQFSGLNDILEDATNELVSVDLDIDFSQFYEVNDNKNWNPESLLCLSTKSINSCSGFIPAQSIWNEQKNGQFWKNNTHNDSKLFYELKNTKPERPLRGRIYKKMAKRYNLTEYFGLKVDALGKIFHHSNIGFILVNNLKWDDFPRLVLTFNREAACGP